MKPSLWRSLDAVPALAAVLNEWKRELGNDFARARPFLQATPEQSAEHPCMNQPDCGCVHRVAPPGRRTGLVAACECGCPVFSLEPKDVVVFALDVAKLGDTARRALTFGPPASSAGHGRCRRVGAAGAAQLPVFFCAPADDAALVRELDGLLAAKAGPFIVLTPTAAHHSPVVESMQGREAFLVLALSRWLALTGVGELTLLPPVEGVRAAIDGVLAAFYRKLAEPSAMAKTVERIDRNIEAVGKQNQELRAAKARLEAMQAEGLFAFASKIDRTTLDQFFAVLASGDVAKASRDLGMKDSSLRSIITRWKGRGKAYAALAEFLRWRKSIKGEAGKEFAKRLASGGERGTDYPALIRDVIGELESFNPDNWADRCDDLSKLLRDALA